MRQTASPRRRQRFLGLLPSAPLSGLPSARVKARFARRLSKPRGWFPVSRCSDLRAADGNPLLSRSPGAVGEALVECLGRSYRWGWFQPSRGSVSWRGLARTLPSKLPTPYARRLPCTPCRSLFRGDGSPPGDDSFLAAEPRTLPGSRGVADPPPRAGHPDRIEVTHVARARCDGRGACGTPHSCCLFGVAGGSAGSAHVARFSTSVCRWVASPVGVVLQHTWHLRSLGGHAEQACRRPARGASRGESVLRRRPPAACCSA
ncbi:hypothetical protein FB559_3126 [Actinoallomurus bryophytorum]|uniref:Uncharacterized protein n=1 Tax=Actinoallomurus bryophytorum TaxID=1490222 RepID=A0A543CKE1_9ACTN|nr:hypothetical protein FB559_3126 [Actinoallomurus bryophytorum]